MSSHDTWDRVGEFFASPPYVRAWFVLGHSGDHIRRLVQRERARKARKYVGVPCMMPDPEDVIDRLGLEVYIDGDGELWEKGDPLGPHEDVPIRLARGEIVWDREPPEGYEVWKTDPRCHHESCLIADSYRRSLPRPELAPDDYGIDTLGMHPNRAEFG